MSQNSSGIEEPYVIASLPKPMHGDKGKILAAPVFSLSASRKRKRHEVVVGIDGETVNVYNVQTQTTASSYALPPQTFLAAPPCSTFYKSTQPRGSVRRTYAAVRNGPLDGRARLLCLSESIGKPTPGSFEAQPVVRKEIKLRAGSIVDVGVFARPVNGSTESLAPLNVVVAYQNGNVDCVEGDVSKTVWEYTAPQKEETEVEYSTVIDSATTVKGLFRNREDILALLNLSGSREDAHNSVPLLCQVIRTGTEKHLHISTIRGHSQTQLTARSSTITELVKYKLPRESSTPAKYELHPASGTLYEHEGRQLRVYDLTGATPKTTFELGRKKSSLVESFARISSSCILTFGTGAASIYETKFGSMLGSLPLSTPADTTSAGAQYAIVTSYSDMSLVVAISANNLVALQVSEATSSHNRKRHAGPALVDVLGKGNASQGLDLVDPNKKQEEKQERWNDWQSGVDAMFDEKLVDALEEFIAADLNIDPTTSSETTKALTNGHANGHTEESELWDLPLSAYDPLHVDGRKANYILSKMFTWRKPSDSPATLEPHRLELVLKSRNILRWLGRMGLLTAPHIQQVLAPVTEHDGARLRVVPGDVMAAVEQIDHGFQLTCDLISLPIHWDLAEIMQALRLLIQSLEDPSPPQADDDVAMTEGGDMESKIEMEVALANRDFARLASVIEDGPLQRSETLRLLIARLQAFPLRDITKSMRSVLSQSQIVFLIRVLLIELYEGGWTSLYVQTSEPEPIDEGLDDIEDVSDVEDASGENNHNISTIAHLLNCAVDAIGTSGWLVGLSGDAGMSDDLIDRLRVQISAAVTGCLEAQSVEMYLGEIMRVAAGKKRKREVEVEGKEEGEEAMLPLGGAFEPPVMKVRGRKKNVAGGVSATERVGKYTFERLRW